ncbi:MAG: YbaB/EbfC family nucleoid-associated protein [Leptospiraceae bacterium]|nr:YbaB/EbfC family nucleoid-associated protein [Leptospiraceae bacterium]
MGIFDKLKNLNEIKELKEEAEKLQEILREIEVTEEAGKGAVQVTVNGEGKVVNVILNDKFFQETDREKQQKWITIAINGAIEKSKRRVEKEMKKTGGFDKLQQLLK